jgi:hypothetical protein
MPDESLILLGKEVRGKTLRLLEGLTDAHARWVPPGLSNSIIWHAGHSYTVVEHLVFGGAGAVPSQPEGWMETFSWKSRPTPDTQFPPLSEVVAKLTDQLTRVTNLVQSLDESRLPQIVDPARGRTLRFCILHGWHDEANHQGEIWLLKKLISKQ